MDDGNEDTAGAGGTRRRREARPRTRVVKFRLSEDEYAVVAEAARREGWACGAFAAHAALAAARGAPLALAGEVRGVLEKLMKASSRVNKVGVNLNQAVAKLNTTGQRCDDLGPIAAYCARVMTHLDEAAIEMATVMAIQRRKKSA